MKGKQVLSILLAGVLTAGTMLTGCGSEESTSTAPAASSEATSAAAAAASSEASEDTTSAAADAAESEDMSDGDITDIEVYGMCLSDMSGVQAVEDAINKITESKIGVHVHLNWIAMGGYSEQISLKMSGNEQMDVMMVTPIQASAFSSLTSQNQLKPLDDLLTQYGTGITSTVGDYIKGCQLNGVTYAIPTYRTLNSDGYIVMRKDILDQLGLTEKAQNLDNWTDFEDIMKQAVKADSTLNGIVNADSDATVITEQCFLNGPDKFADDTTYDPLGDTYKIIASDSSTNKVYDYFESDAYYQMLKRVKSWYDEGLVYKDAATSEVGGDELMKTKVGFSYVCQSEIGVETSKKAATGYDVVCPKFCSIPVSTTSCTKFCWGIPVTSKEPEAAMKFLNLMYTDADICNLLAWGVEGTDYVVKDGQACYPDGVDATSVAYHSADFMYGNQFLCLPWDGQGADFRDTAKKSLEDAGTSPYLGFSCDTTSISNELTAVYNVIQQYKGGLETGSVEDLDSNYAEFKTALQNAGVDKVIAEYQKQLDAWLAAKN
ncbi:MAG: ABC transporter substrate-binding protein [Lachnospiraceae bacterium]|jgi:putative aldouronate transport system substrate-binding protein|nr:ABC transporter substrate-binding protein [Lachnospiraceae bacterium]